VVLNLYFLRPKNEAADGGKYMLLDAEESTERLSASGPREIGQERESIRYVSEIVFSSRAPGFETPFLFAGRSGKGYPPAEKDYDILQQDHPPGSREKSWVLKVGQ